MPSVCECLGQLLVRGSLTQQERSVPSALPTVAASSSAGNGRVRVLPLKSCPRGQPITLSPPSGQRGSSCVWLLQRGPRGAGRRSCVQDTLAGRWPTPVPPLALSRCSVLPVLGAHTWNPSNTSCGCPWEPRLGTRAPSVCHSL